MNASGSADSEDPNVNEPLARLHTMEKNLRGALVLLDAEEDLAIPVNQLAATVERRLAEHDWRGATTHLARARAVKTLLSWGEILFWKNYFFEAIEAFAAANASERLFECAATLLNIEQRDPAWVAHDAALALEAREKLWPDRSLLEENLTAGNAEAAITVAAKLRSTLDPDVLTACGNIAMEHECFRDALCAYVAARAWGKLQEYAQLCFARGHAYYGSAAAAAAGNTETLDAWYKEYLAKSEKAHSQRERLSYLSAGSCANHAALAYLNAKHVPRDTESLNNPLVLLPCPPPGLHEVMQEAH